MASSPPNNFDFPRFPPPPPFQPFHRPPPPPPPSRRFSPPPPSPFRPIVSPPPPHVRPPPAPVPPSPSPNNHPIVIVVVFVSLGGLLFLSLLASALFCFVQRRKKKKTQETEITHIDEHKKVKKAIVSGPFGQQTVMSSVEDDVHIDEEIIKNEKLDHGLHAKSSADEGNTSTTSLEMGTISGFDHHHHQVERRP